MVVFNDVCYCIDVVYVIVSCVVNVCTFPKPGKNGYADWYEFKFKRNSPLCLKLCSQSQDYIHGLTVLLKLPVCCIRKGDCSIRVIRFF